MTKFVVYIHLMIVPLWSVDAISLADLGGQCRGLAIAIATNIRIAKASAVANLKTQLANQNILASPFEVSRKAHEMATIQKSAPLGIPPLIAFVHVSVGRESTFLFWLNIDHQATPQLSHSEAIQEILRADPAAQIDFGGYFYLDNGILYAEGGRKFMATLAMSLPVQLSYQQFRREPDKSDLINLLQTMRQSGFRFYPQTMLKIGWRSLISGNKPARLTMNSLMNEGH